MLGLHPCIAVLTYCVSGDLNSGLRDGVAVSSALSRLPTVPAPLVYISLAFSLPAMDT